MTNLVQKRNHNGWTVRLESSEKGVQVCLIDNFGVSCFPDSVFIESNFLAENTAISLERLFDIFSKANKFQMHVEQSLDGKRILRFGSYGLKGGMGFYQTLGAAAGVAQIAAGVALTAGSGGMLTFLTIPMVSSGFETTRYSLQTDEESFSGKKLLQRAGVAAVAAGVSGGAGTLATGMTALLASTASATATQKILSTVIEGEELPSFGDLAKEVAIGSVSGVVGGAVAKGMGDLTTKALGDSAKKLSGAIVKGMAKGGAGGVAKTATANLLNGNDFSAGITEAAVGGGLLNGGIGVVEHLHPVPSSELIKSEKKLTVIGPKGVRIIDANDANGRELVIRTSAMTSGVINPRVEVPTILTTVTVSESDDQSPPPPPPPPPFWLWVQLFGTMTATTLVAIRVAEIARERAAARARFREVAKQAAMVANIKATGRLVARQAAESAKSIRLWEDLLNNPSAEIFSLSDFAGCVDEFASSTINHPLPVNHKLHRLIAGVNALIKAYKDGVLPDKVLGDLKVEFKQRFKGLWDSDDRKNVVPENIFRLVERFYRDSFFQWKINSGDSENAYFWEERLNQTFSNCVELSDGESMLSRMLKDVGIQLPWNDWVMDKLIDRIFANPEFAGFVLQPWADRLTVLSSRLKNASEAGVAAAASGDVVVAIMQHGTFSASRSSSPSCNISAMPSASNARPRGA